MPNNEKISFNHKLKLELTTNKYSNEEWKEIILLGLKVNAFINIQNQELTLYITSFYPAVIKFFKLGIKNFFPNVQTSIKQVSRSLFGEVKKEFKLEIGNCDDLYSEIKSQQFRGFFCAAIAVFLLSGNINSPTSQNYSLYMSFTSEEYAHSIYKLSKKHSQLGFKLLKIKNKYLLKINRAENISNFCKYIFCFKAYFEYEDILITRDYFNNSNRLSILDISNQTKAIEANKKHEKWIIAIKNDTSLNGNFTIEEKRIMHLKLQNDSLTAKEITKTYFEKYKTAITKSKVNNLVEKIKKIYIRNNLDK